MSRVSGVSLPIGVSAMMHGYLAFDAAGELLVPFRTWRNTNTGPAAAELSELFGVNIPLRWSVAHLRQAVLDGEPHLDRIASITTLAGHVHERLTGRRSIGQSRARRLAELRRTCAGAPCRFRHGKAGELGPFANRPAACYGAMFDVMSGHPTCLQELTAEFLADFCRPAPRCRNSLLGSPNARNPGGFARAPGFRQLMQRRLARFVELRLAMLASDQNRRSNVASPFETVAFFAPAEHWVQSPKNTDFCTHTPVCQRLSDGVRRYASSNRIANSQPRVRTRLFSLGQNMATRQSGMWIKRAERDRVRRCRRIREVG